MKRLLVLICIAFVAGACSTKQLSWVAVGDSITYLNDHLDETGHRVTKGYMTRVTEKLPGMNYVNKGYNGWTSGGIADEIENLGLGSADVYSVFLGTNDWWQGRPVGTLNDYKNNTGSATLFGSYRIIIDKLKSLNKDARLILITPMQRCDFVYLANLKNNAYGSYKEKNGQTLAQFAEAIIAIGRYENAAVVDLYAGSGITVENAVKYKRLKDPATGAYREYTYPDFIDIPFYPETDEYPYPVGAIDMTYDGLHPSDRGNEIIAEMIEKVIRK
ncbi:MAG: SGNH/GDSL hydrolase family protein [Anaerolineales bacterium]|nr:SGNH/GDSL hydrolase family protein [Anaerolineales bacterium]